MPFITQYEDRLLQLLSSSVMMQMCIQQALFSELWYLHKDVIHFISLLSMTLKGVPLIFSCALLTNFSIMWSRVYTYFQKQIHCTKYHNNKTFLDVPVDVIGPSNDSLVLQLASIEMQCQNFDMSDIQALNFCLSIEPFVLQQFIRIRVYTKPEKNAHSSKVRTSCFV